MNTGINIAGPKKKAVEAARDAILDLLNAGRDEKTTRTAIEAFRSVVEIKNVTVQNCTIGDGYAGWAKPE